MYLSYPSTILRSYSVTLSAAIAHCPADDVGFPHVKVTVTHGAPLSIDKDLQPTRPRYSSTSGAVRLKETEIAGITV